MVKASDRVGNLWVIDSGLKPGEKVIVEGVQRVKPGMTVNAKALKSEAEAAPPGAATSETKAKAAEGK
jgi:membrane fusion protein (multidrug efflux system)